ITFRFTELPTELAFMVLKYAAQPTFDQAERYDRQNPYSSALNLCLVSKSVRRAVLPELLHTVSLREPRNVKAFVQALLMQEAYKEANNRDFKFDYASHVHRMWIKSPGDDLAPASERSRVISLLTPVIFAAPSLALGWTSVDLLVECLEHAWKSRPAILDGEEHPRPPWKTQTLTITLGIPISNTKWNSLTSTPQGSAFLASIRRLSSATYLYRDFTSPLPPTSSQDYSLPDWMKTAPLASFTNLQTVILPYPRTKGPISIVGVTSRGIDMHVEMLTFP
ncbi:uncharacterized protein EDB93DRAFT_1046082, partial [Suillus bovinus]|uniref:uncharacterized protein n=1 Tax=Suillus bovinus TaxID=48563 RepID=UPI001B87AC49